MPYDEAAGSEPRTSFGSTTGARLIGGVRIACGAPESAYQWVGSTVPAGQSLGPSAPGLRRFERGEPGGEELGRQFNLNMIPGSTWRSDDEDEPAGTAGFRGFRGVVALLSAGCGGGRDTARVSVDRVEPGRRLEITGSLNTSLYRVVSKVAVRAPDVCANQNASEATGAARRDAPVSTLIKTSCGVEMAELERSLTKRGYQVVSWKMLSNIVAADNTVPYLDAARRLGAQVLFQVNSLERVNIFPGQDARLERRFFQSNRFGDALAPATLQDDSIERLRPLILEQEQNLRTLARLGAMLDVNATVVESGQSMWFYRASKIEMLHRDDSAGLLLTSKKKQGWAVTAPQRKDGSEEKPRVARSAEMVAVSSGRRSADEENAAYFVLVRSAVDDFAQSFASGQTGTGVSQGGLPPLSMPPPPPRP